VTGPTYPLSGTARLGNTSLQYQLERSHSGQSDAPVALTVPDTSVTGLLQWRRYRSDDEWERVALKREGETLRSALPHQPPAGKIQYRIALFSGADSLLLPAGSPALLRFKGDVPPGTLAAHVLLMFVGMLFSTRTGLSVFSGRDEIGRLTFLTIAFLTAGGVFLGPVVQKYAFGAYWTGWPFGTDLTDNKTVAPLIAWIAVAFARKRTRRPRLWALGAALITLAVFMIPHSLFGSELDYRESGPAAREAGRSVSFVIPARPDECAPHGRGHGRGGTAYRSPQDLIQLLVGRSVLTREIHSPASLLTECSLRVPLLQIDERTPVHVRSRIRRRAE
jgi:hypothetical protein